MSKARYANSRSRSTRRPPTRRAASARKRRKPGSVRLRRRLLFIIGAGCLVGLIGIGKSSFLSPAVKEISLPLKHEDIIRQQAKAKSLDPALIAAVIFAETKFRPRTSSAGAKGLMQILPSTATFIARKSGGSAFTEEDLATPQINISYGTFYLRYLMNNFHNNVFRTLAAYNAGEGTVNQWMAEAQATGNKFDSVDDIPFPETRAYVVRVLAARDRYRAEYASELGL